MDKSLLASHESELKALAKAVGTAERGGIAVAASALFVKVLTGSSIAASAAESTAKSFGQWLADNPDMRLEAAAKALEAQDREHDALDLFAALVEAMVTCALKSVEGVLEHLEAGQQALHAAGTRLLAGQLGLEALMEQSLRSTGLLSAGHDEIRAMLEDVRSLLQAQADQSARRRLVVPPPALPRVWTVPHASNPYFTGRTTVMEALCDALKPDDRAAVALCGMGGIGKTQVAVEYAWIQRARYDVVLWVSADTTQLLDAGLASLTGPKALDLPEQTLSEQAVQLSAVEQWMRQSDRWLLVVDNVDTEAAARAARALVQRVQCGHILFTARSRPDWRPTVEPIELEKLSVEAATDFLLKRTGGSSSLGSAAAATELARTLDSLPLALEQAAAYIERRKLRFRDYARKIEHALRTDVTGGTNYNRSVAATWFVTESELSPAARNVLRLSCFLAASPIPRHLYAGKADVFREGLALCGYRGDDPVEDLCDAGLVQLNDYSLIELAATEFSCHRLLAEVQRERLLGAERKAWVSCVLRIVAAATDADPNDARSLAMLSPMQPHMLELVEHADALGIAKDTALLMNRVAELLESKANFGEAAPLLRRALAIDEASYGKNHPEVAMSITNLAKLLTATGGLREAESLMRRVLAIDEACFDAEHPNIARDLSNLALLLRDTNRFAEAEPLMRRALSITEATCGAGDPTVAMRLTNLALVLRDTNRFVEAEPLMRRALSIDEACYDAEHPDVARDLNNLAMLLRDRNHLVEAEPLMRRALSIDEATYGAEHPTVARDLGNLSQLLRDTKRLAEAEPLLRRALSIDEVTHGAEHPNVAVHLNNLAQLMWDTKRLVEAEPLARRALAIFESSFGAEHHYVATCLNNLAQLMWDTRRLTDAETLMRRALAIDEASFGKEHPHVARDLSNLALLLKDTSRVAAAQTLMRRALSICLASFGPDHPRTENARRGLDRLLERDGR